MSRRTPVTAPELLFKIVLIGTSAHYESPGLVTDKRLEKLLLAGKQILYKSHQESEVRQNLGFSPAVWTELTTCLHRAIPVLEQQSISYAGTANDNDYNGSSSDLIAANYLSLVKDIERLNDLCTIARNLLATTRKAQNLAAEKAFDQQILKLIDVCVRVTARGFDGESNQRNQDKWQKVVNLYKRLLITCLQFLHNFIMHNEHRKLVLWLDLFGSTSAAAQQAQQNEIQAVQEQINREGRLTMQAEVETVPDNELAAYNRYENSAQPVLSAEVIKSLQEISSGDLGYNIDDVHALFDLMSAERVLDAESQERKRILMDKIRTDLERMSGLTATQLDDNPDILLRAGAALREHLALRDFSARNAARAPPLPRRASSLLNARSSQLDNLPELAQYASLTAADQEITDEDLIMPRTSSSAAETLQEAKDELMTRLQDHQPLDEEGEDQLFEPEPEPEQEHEEAGMLDDGVVVDSAQDSAEDEEEDEEEDEDYHRPGDQERGLLTDVPLVLGPTEIEALPMIIQAGIVENFGMKNSIERQGARNMQAVRCHILLAQEAGRNVLRELLIFIAAWDLPDDEFYFKMMVQIMEAILKNGLMSHAYSDFGQAKDIISPAQAVVIKILTHIFRTRYSPSHEQNSNERLPAKPRIPAPLSRVDVLTVRYIFTVFRGNIIPETCALIYLQGQIRANLAIAEDFPLNLWDMERVYEGVYQFLEFFAVLTENNDWKRLLVEWEIVYDLVTLIKELDASIPKANLALNMPAHGKAPPRDRQSFRGHLSNAYAAANSQNNNSSDPNTKTALPEQDPSDFEWRNLKKLIVLVLSSLVWRSRVVQDQIRENGGVGTILSCTQYDGHNPYIKEHAVMCLKFLLEGNKENQAIIRDLEAQGVANSAELEQEFGVRADVRDGRVRVEQQHRAPSLGHHHATPTGQRTYHQDQNYYAQQQFRNPHAGPSRPVRRASEGAASSAAATAEKLANMTERFNRLDIGNFARGLPLRQQHRPSQGVSLPKAQSVRTAHEVVEVAFDESFAEENESEEQVKDEDGREGRVFDVGDMI